MAYMNNMILHWSVGEVFISLS